MIANICVKCKRIFMCSCEGVCKPNICLCPLCLKDGNKKSAERYIKKNMSCFKKLTFKQVFSKDDDPWIQRPL